MKIGLRMQFRKKPKIKKFLNGLVIPCAPQIPLAVFKKIKVNEPQNITFIYSQASSTNSPFESKMLKSSYPYNKPNPVMAIEPKIEAISD